MAALLDGAMSNCLMALGIESVAADLQVRYAHPVEVGVADRVVAKRRQRRE